MAADHVIREVLTASLREGIQALDPARVVAERLPPLPPKHARVVVVAAGKAADAMVRGAVTRWPDRIAETLVARGAHPVPDERSVASAEAALDLARSLGPRDLLLALISGGASAMLAAPPPGVSLEAKRALVARLLESGTPIREVNLVRRHFSRVKGGRLALAAGAARVLTFVVSDVIEGEPHDVGSGPTVADPTTLIEARAILRRAGIDEPLGLDESAKPGQLRARAWMIADPPALARRIADALTRRGLVARVDPPDEGDALEIARRRVTRAATLAEGEAVVIATEPTVTLPAQRGRGGRAGRVALAAMDHLPEDVTLLCAASDGVDGSGGAAGAIVTRDDARRAPGGAIAEALASFDDARLHADIGTALGGGPTGNNLTDVHVLVRRRRRA